VQEDLRVRVGGNIVGLTTALAGAQRSVGKFAQSVKRHAMIIGASFAGVVLTAAVIGAKFDKEMRFVREITQATEKEFEQMTAIAEEMGRTTEFTARQAAEGLRFLGMAGLDAGQTIEALPQMLDLATAGMLDLGRAADIATNILLQFGMEVSELSRVSDVLAQVQSRANTNIEEASQAFIYGGTMATQFGMDIEQVAGIVGLLANRGIKASLAGTTLRQAMMKMLNPSKKAAEALEDYGIIIKKTDGSLRNFTDVILDMVDAKMSAQDAAKILGARAGQLAAIFSMTSEEVIEFINVMYAAEGRAKSLAEAIRESFWGAWKTMLSKIEAMFLKFFKTFESAGIAAFNTIGEVVDHITEFLVDNAKVIEDAFLSTVESVANAFLWLHKQITRAWAGWKVIQRGLAQTRQELAMSFESTIQKGLAEGRYGLPGSDTYKAAIVRLEGYKKTIRETTELMDELEKSAIALYDQPAKFAKAIDSARESFSKFKKEAEVLQSAYETTDIYSPFYISKKEPKKFTRDTDKMQGDLGAEAAEKAAKRYAKAWDDMRKEEQRKWKAFSDNIANSFVDATRGWIEGTRSFKEAFRAMASSIISEIMRIVVYERLSKVLSAGVKAAMTAVSDWWSPYGMGAPGSYAAMDMPDYYSPASVGHRGGVVGQTLMPTRMVPTSLFDNASRLHEGLQPDEFPAILQRGETVTPKGGGPNIQINIVNQGQDVKAEQRGEAKFDGKKWVMEMVLTNLQQSQGFRQAIRSA